MKRYIFAAAMMLLAGCNSGPAGSPPGLIGSFQLTNADGRPSSVFKYGEDLFLEYRLANLTGTDVRFNTYYDALAGFGVYSSESGIGGSTLTALGHAPVPGVLRNATSLAYKTSWLSSPTTFWLLPGDYEVSAYAAAEFEGYAPPQHETLHFKVVSDEEHIFSVSGQGFLNDCAFEGQVYWASVFRSRQGVYTLRAGVFTASEQPSGECFHVRYPDMCLRQSIVGPRTLTAAQVATLQRLMAEFPRVQPEGDSACDPCFFTSYRIGTEVHGVSPCVTGPPEYVEHQWDLLTFVKSLAVEH